MKILLVLSAVIAITACGSSAPKVDTEPVTNTRTQSERVKDTVASHTVEGDREKVAAANAEEPVPAKSTEKRKWSRSGDAIDTSKFDAAIQKASSELKQKPGDPAAKKKLGTAYFERGVALTAARQYASAIGDFRKAFSNDPANTDAQKQINMITAIYNSMNIQVPGEGEEPAALEFDKQKD